MICQRCGLEGAIDLDTGGQYHAEPSECIERQGERIAELERIANAAASDVCGDEALHCQTAKRLRAERDQWQESSGQNYVRAQDAEAERDRLRDVIKQALDEGCVIGSAETLLRKALENTDGQ